MKPPASSGHLCPGGACEGHFTDLAPDWQYFATIHPMGSGPPHGHLFPAWLTTVLLRSEQSAPNNWALNLAPLPPQTLPHAISLAQNSLAPYLLLQSLQSPQLRHAELPSFVKGELAQWRFPLDPEEALPPGKTGV